MHQNSCDCQGICLGKTGVCKSEGKEIASLLRGMPTDGFAMDYLMYQKKAGTDFQEIFHTRVVSLAVNGFSSC